MNSHDAIALDSILAELSQAWDTGDAARCCAQFASDAEQVNIFGGQLIGRDEIIERHARVFATVFRDSTNALQVLGARYAVPDIMLARILSVVEVPQGPLQGTLQTIGSLVLRKTAAQWEILLFHNTRLSRDAAINAQLQHRAAVDCKDADGG